MFGNLGAPELILIFLIILLVFGANRIPEIARGIGRGIREFKDSAREITSQMDMEDTSNRGGENRDQIRHPQPPAQGAPTARGEGSPQRSATPSEGAAQGASAVPGNEAGQTSPAPHVGETGRSAEPPAQPTQSTEPGEGTERRNG